MPANPEIPPGFVRMQVGEIITPGTLYWRSNAGPWAAYADASLDTQTDVGTGVTHSMFCHIRRETHVEFLARTNFESTILEPPPGFRWLEEGEFIPASAMVVSQAAASRSYASIAASQFPTTRDGYIYRDPSVSIDRYLVPLSLQARPRPATTVAVVTRRPPANIRKAKVTILPLP